MNKQGTNFAITLVILLVIIIITVIVMSPNPPKPNPTTNQNFTKWECTQVVGSTHSNVKVFKCLDPDTNKCYYINQNGGMLETDCVKHPLAD